MGCLKSENEEYKGKIIKMPSKKDDKQKNIKDETELYTVPKSTISVIKWVLGGCGALLLTILSIGGWMANQLYDLNKNALTEDSMVISGIQDDINDIGTDVKDINNGLNGERGIYARLAIVEEKLDTPTISASADTQQFVGTVSFVRNDINISTSSISSDTCIGTDSDGKVYIAEDLIGERILLTYTEDDKEVYFLGQYNENYHWDGYCITNTYYLDNTLYDVCESDFDDGKRLDYKSFYVSEIKNEWIYTDRNCKKDVNEGVSIRYKFNYDKIKNFTNTNVRISDVIYIEDFDNDDNKTILSCYSGLTSNGLYNDNTGDAYLIKYNESGFVRTFYKGKFKDGDFQDENALEIVFDESNNINRYFIYKGKFIKGNRVNNEGIKYITKKDIDEIMKENGCPNTLNWYEEKS